MDPTAPATPAAGEALGRELVGAVADRDWDRFGGCLADGVIFRAVVPSDIDPLREHVGRAAACAQMARWFDGGDVYDVIESGVEMIADRLHVRYRCTGLDEGQWYLIEQHVFAAISAHGIEHLDLVCSGFRTSRRRPDVGRALSSPAA